MTAFLRSMSIVLTSLSLAACGETEPSFVCTGGFTGGMLTSSTASCPGCQVDDASAAIDGNGDRAAYLIFNRSNVNPNGGQVSLTAGGRSFPAGSTVGAFMRFPRSDQRGYTNISASFVTYLGGVQQEMVFGSRTNVGNINGSGQTTFYGGATSLAFDAVEAIASLGNTPEAATVELFEICGAR